MNTNLATWLSLLHTNAVDNKKHQNKSIYFPSGSREKPSIQVEGQAGLTSEVIWLLAKSPSNRTDCHFFYCSHPDRAYQDYWSWTKVAHKASAIYFFTLVTVEGWKDQHSLGVRRLRCAKPLRSDETRQVWTPHKDVNAIIGCSSSYSCVHWVSILQACF